MRESGRGVAARMVSAYDGRLRLARWAARYRPYVLAVVAVLVVTALPSARDFSDTTGEALVTAPRGSDVGGTGVDLGAGTGDLENGATSIDSAPVGDGTTATTIGVSARGAVGASTPSAAAPDDAPRRPQPASRPLASMSAGIGTPEALAAPDCDPATKKITISFTNAPACVRPWPDDADNGGTTYQGVTSDTIKVVVEVHSSNTASDATVLAQIKDAAAPYEHFFRLWGRKVEFMTYRIGANDETSQRADAIKIADLKPFAVIGVLSTSIVLITELARRKIVVQNDASLPVDISLTLAPYAWGTVLHPDELVAANSANYVGRKLWGKRARWAGQPDYQASVRRFGLVYPSTWDVASLGIFKEVFSSYGGSLVDAVSYPYPAATYLSSWPERQRTMVARLKSKGVTSVITAADLIFLPGFTKEATSQQWSPEWIMTGLGGQDLDLFSRTFDQTQWSRAFGVGALAIGGDKPAGPMHFCLWYWGDDNSDRCRSTYVRNHVLPLYAGLHGAGPLLTPESFKDGLFSLPPAGGAASNAVMSPQISFGKWGFFSWENFNAYNDFTEVWWDATAQGPDLATGAPSVGKYRYMNGGRRYLPLTWPQSEPDMFNTNGTAVWYSELPPGDRPPQHPCTGCPSEGG